MNNISCITQIESWFIPLDILMVICTSFVVILSFVFSTAIVCDRSCRTVSVLLIFNSFVSEFLFGTVMCSIAILSLYNDVKQMTDQDSLCIFRGYLSYAFSAVRSHSYILQSVYRCITVVYPNFLLWQSARLQILLISFTWFISIIHPFPFLFTNQIQYNVDNQVCHMPLQNYPYIFYTCFMAYLYPVTIIVVIYVKLVRYTKAMSKVVTPVNQLVRAQRELKMVRRIVMLVIVLITLGLPHTVSFISAFFTEPYRYHFRIAFLSVDVSLGCVIVALVQFNDPVNNFVSKKIIEIFNIVTL